jgi:glycosyltransferase involved in cell wall biosynthesis
VTAPVSVVMAAWNAERFLGEALRSVLVQTAPPAEIVVVDDGSSDGTATLAESLDRRVRVVRRAHEGAGAARNAGLAEASGAYIAFLDADDMWLPRKLERQVAVLDSDSSVEAVFCLVDEFHDFGEGSPAVRPPRRKAAAMLAGAALLRRDVVDRLGPFPTVLLGDWVRWWARARAVGVREHVVSEVLFRRRIHGGNNSVRRQDGGATYLAIARDHLHARGVM